MRRNNSPQLIDCSNAHIKSITAGLLRIIVIILSIYYCLLSSVQCIFLIFSSFSAASTNCFFSNGLIFLPHSLFCFLISSYFSIYSLSFSSRFLFVRSSDALPVLSVSFSSFSSVNSSLATVTCSLRRWTSPSRIPIRFLLSYLPRDDRSNLFPSQAT